MSWPPADGSSSSGSSRGRGPSPTSPHHQHQQPMGLQGGLSRPQFFFGNPSLLHHGPVPPPLPVPPACGSGHSPLLSPNVVLYQEGHGSPSSSSQGSTCSSSGLARGSSPSRIATSSPGASNRPYKVCGVCGDRAKSYHFGGISCDSCKAFFRRSVQNEAFRNFHCPYDGRCEITIGSRKCCQFCRFNKCLSIGMEKGWVMTEEERMQLLKNRMEKKQREQGSKSPAPAASSAPGVPSLVVVATTSTSASEKRRKWKASSGESSGSAEHEPDLDLSKYLSHADVARVERLVNAYEVSYKSIPLVPRLDPSRTDILELFFTVIKQFAHFSRQLDSFDAIGSSDQEVLLRCGVLELCFIRGAYVFDEVRLCWPDKSLPLYQDAFVLSAEDLKKLVSHELHDKHLRFVQSLRDMDLDEPTTMLLLVIVLLSPDRPNLSDADLVAREQEKYYLLLQRYMSWRYGPDVTSSAYPKLLLKLPDLRELSDAHTDFHLLLEREEMEEIQRRLSLLRVDATSGGAATSGAEVTARPAWTLKAYLATLLPPSPGSLEDDSSSDSSDRTGSYGPAS